MRGKSAAKSVFGKACASTPKHVLMHVRVVAERGVELLRVVEKQSRLLRWQSLMLDLDQNCLRIGSSVVSATRAEFSLLHLLISRRNLPMTREFIMSHLFGHEHGRDLRQVDMFVVRLRQSLAAFGLAGLIHTINGRGYAVLDDHVDAAADAQPQAWAVALGC